MVVNRINTVMSRDGFRYITRREECEMPPSVIIPTSEGRQVYELFAVIDLDGVASPTSGRTQGHYTAYLKYGRSWFHMNDNVVKKLPSRLLSIKAYVNLCICEFESSLFNF